MARAERVSKAAWWSRIRRRRGKGSLFLGFEVGHEGGVRGTMGLREGEKGQVTVVMVDGECRVVKGEGERERSRKGMG